MPPVTPEDPCDETEIEEESQETEEITIGDDISSIIIENQNKMAAESIEEEDVPEIGTFLKEHKDDNVITSEEIQEMFKRTPGSSKDFNKVPAYRVVFTGDILVHRTDTQTGKEPVSFEMMYKNSAGNLVTIEAKREIIGNLGRRMRGENWLRDKKKAIMKPLLVELSKCGLEIAADVPPDDIREKDREKLRMYNNVRLTFSEIKRSVAELKEKERAKEKKRKAETIREKLGL